MKISPIKLLPLLILGFLIACTGEVDNSNIKKGSKNAPQTEVENASKYRTDNLCQDENDCPYYYCLCNNGDIVNSRTCDNGYCLNPNAHCEHACTVFGSEGWSGEYGGGEFENKPKEEEKEKPEETSTPNFSTPESACRSVDAAASAYCGTAPTYAACNNLNNLIPSNCHYESIEASRCFYDHANEVNCQAHSFPDETCEYEMQDFQTCFENES